MAAKNLLFVPHAPPARNLVTRGEALARGLAADFNVFLLSWRGVSQVEQPRPVRLLSRLAGLFTPAKRYARDGITVVESPFLYVRRPGMEFLRTLNTGIVNRIVVRYGIDVIVNELALVNSTGFRKPYIVDIVDLPTARELARWSSQTRCAAGITTITEGLRMELAAVGMEAEVIPNGADLNRFRQASGEKVRKEFDFDGRFVIGYIGNHAEWSGLLFLLDVFKIVKSSVPEACLMIVGMGSEVPKARAKVERETIPDVLFAGPVNAEDVPDYFTAIDLGVLPFELDPHAALSFPIKVIEYSAARKMVVASPLEMLKRIGLPNVRIVERDTEHWARSIVEAKSQAWKDVWDGVVEAYDWKNLSSRLASYVKSRVRL